MSRPDGTKFLDRVDQKVHSLRGSGVDSEALRLGVLAVAEEGLPWRDSIVLRYARQAADRKTPRAQAAWDQVCAGLKRSVPESTYAIWFKPLQLLGEDRDQLILAAEVRIRSWVERRYMGLLGEAVRAETDFAGARFAATLPKRRRLER